LYEKKITYVAISSDGSIVATFNPCKYNNNIRPCFQIKKR
jgi:hypothetical protein